MRPCLAITALAILISPATSAAAERASKHRSNVSLDTRLSLRLLVPSHQCACGDDDSLATTADLLSADPATTLRQALKRNGLREWTPCTWTIAPGSQLQ